MTHSLPSFSLVSISSLDVRRRPDHRSELTSQLLMGEAVRVRRASRDGRWWWIESQVDGYAGWSRNWGLLPASRAEAGRWALRARGRVASPFAEARSLPGGGDLVSPLSWRGRVVLGSAKGAYRRIELPDGRRAWVDSDRIAAEGTSPRDLWARVRNFLGLPYLWGGRTPLGIDCSAYTQLLLAEWGYRIPRDAHQQYLATRALRDREPPRPGDLVFFARSRGPMAHVGVMLAKGLFGHARGCVRVNSLDPCSALFDKELWSQLRGIHRPRGGTPPTLESGFEAQFPT